MKTKEKIRKRIHKGKSFGVCFKCGQEYKLKRKTKHNKDKKPLGICPKCAKVAVARKE